MEAIIMTTHTYTCDSCGIACDDRSIDRWTKVEGWVKQRDQGGANHIAHKRCLDVHRCELCMDRGDAKGQMSMFGGAA